MVKITDKAVVALKYILIQENIENFFFRIGIEGDEIRGIGYAIEFVKTPDLNDEVKEINGLKFVINKTHKKYIENLTVDYYEDEEKHGIIFKKEKE